MSVISETGLSLSPYPGLRPFRRDEADIFFGREEQVDQLLGKLETCRFLAVVGSSGCGKSSLVRAGMLSALEGGFMAGNVDLAARTLRESMRTSWMPPLNQLALGLIEYKSGNYDAAKDLLEKVREWRSRKEDARRDGYVDVLIPDWVEAHVLLPELEAPIAKGPLERKPVAAARPNRR